MGGLQENAFINVKNRSSVITAQVNVQANANGVLVAMGGHFGGYALYVVDGKPMFTYNWVGKAEYDVKSTKAMTPGKHQIVFQFDYDGGGLGKGGNGTLFLDGSEAGKGPAGFCGLGAGADVTGGDVTASATGAASILAGAGVSLIAAGVSCGGVPLD